MAFKQRRLNVDATSWRCTLHTRHVPAGNMRASSYSARPSQLAYKWQAKLESPSFYGNWTMTSSVLLSNLAD